MYQRLNIGPVTARCALLAPLVLAALAAGCADDAGDPSGSEGTPPEPPPPVGSCAPLPAVTGFVGRDGPHLTVDGRRFRALGANVYYLQQLFSYAQQDKNDAASAPAREALDHLACMSLPIARIVAFNDTTDKAGIRPAPGVFREEGLRGLDQAVAEAKARGIRVILVLSNNHPNYGGIPAFAHWAGKRHDDFFADRDMRQYWKDYASLLAARVNTFTGIAYKDEPGILAWEIANELRCPGCRGTRRLNDTVRELAQHLKPLVPRHLIGDGGEGFDDEPALYPGLSNQYAVRGDEGASFSKLVNIPELDLISYHLYPRAWGLNVGRDVGIWIDGHELLAKIAGKVPYLGEFGWDPPPETRDRARAPVYDEWLTRMFERNGGAQGFLWQVIPPARRPTADDGFGVVYGTDNATVSVLTAWARQLN